MNKSDFKKGNIAYLRIIKGSNAYRYISEQDRNNPEKLIKECEIISVGKKYVTVLEIGKSRGFAELKFDMTDNFYQKTDYSADYELYSNKQDAINQIEVETLMPLIRDKLAFSSIKRIGYEKIKKIYDILFE